MEKLKYKIGQIIYVMGRYKAEIIDIWDDGMEVKNLEGIRGICRHNNIHSYRKYFIEPTKIN